MVKAKGWLVALFAAVLLFFLPRAAYANNIDSIDIRAVLHEDGSMTVTDHRVFHVDRGTEHFLSLTHLGDSEISDVSVSEEGRPLTDIGEWDINASLEEKAGKYGIHPVSNGVELCFGIGSYGQKDFTITYRVSNVVKLLEDKAQAVYWQFIAKDMEPISRVHIAVSNDIGFSYEYPKTRMWGFGWEGKTNLGTQEITMDSGENFSSEEYMVLLAIFPENTFQTTSNLEYTSDGLLSLAREGSTMGDPDAYDSGEDNGIFSAVRSFSDIVPYLIAIAFGVRFFISMSKRKKRLRVRPTVAKDYYFHEPPYAGPFADTAVILGASTENVIAAFFLKWLREGRIEQRMEEKGLIFKKDISNYWIPSKEPRDGDSAIEKKLWTIICEAAGSGDPMLEEKEFNRYIRKHYPDFKAFEEAISSFSEAEMEKKGYIESKRGKSFGFPIIKKEASAAGVELANNMQGFKQYLSDYSLLAEREQQDVMIWDSWLIWAAYFGIAEKVYEQFKIVNPEYEQMSSLSSNNLYFAYAVSSNIMDAYHSSVAAHSSGGGGGISFSGGGGGSFGGGGGGSR